MAHEKLTEKEVSSSDKGDKSNKPPQGAGLRKLYKKIAYINEIDIRSKKVFLRLDYNVPLDDDGNVTDDSRITATLPTIDYALAQGAKLIIASHLGRPGGKRDPELSLAPVAKKLQKLLKKRAKVVMAPDCVGEEVREITENMDNGQVVLLENLRFHPGEVDNDEDFARELAELADVYVNDAFAVSHRNNASVVAITKFFEKCAAGFLIKRELTYFSRAMEEPARPLVAILGGVKVSDKLSLIERMTGMADKIIIGGAMANTFLKAMGCEIGGHIVEDELVDEAKRLIKKARDKKLKFYLPVDVVVADSMEPDAQNKIVSVQEIPRGWYALDIGPATTLLFREALQDARTIIWNGPMGVFEKDPYSRGTFAMVHYVANSHALSIVGGGDTDLAIRKSGEPAQMSYISTAGGAFLELLEGKTLPAIAALMECKDKMEKED